jgi:hypothetical protein
VTECEKKDVKKDVKDVKDGKKEVESILTAEEEKLSPEEKEALKIKREDEKILQGAEIRANNDAFEACGGKELPPAAEPPVMRCHWVRTFMLRLRCTYITFTLHVRYVYVACALH